MTAGLRLGGLRFRGEAVAPIEAILIARETENSWRAKIRPADRVAIGDRLRFGETAESLACFLGFLDADVVEKHDDVVLLSFHFTGAALDDALLRLGAAPPCADRHA